MENYPKIFSENSKIILKIIKIFLFMFFIILYPLFVLCNWIPVGIGGGGAQYAPSISPFDPNLRFVGSDMKGWYRSTDGGLSWAMIDFYQLVTDVDYGWNNGFMCKMAFNPSNPDIIYGYGPQQDTDNQSNIMISMDAGITWSVLNSSPAWGNARVTCIYPDRANQNMMLVGTDSGVYTSTNGGISFTGPGGSSGYVNGIMIDQSSPAGNRTCYAGSWNGIFRSINNGLSWTAFNTGLPSSNTAGFCGASTASGSRLFEIDGNNYFIYTSLNGGAWTLSGNADTYYMVACADNDTSTAFSINGSDRSVWKTSDGGGTWAKAFTDTAPAANASLGWISYDLSFSWGAPNTMIAVCPSDSSKSMFTNYGETILTNDGGATWQEAYSTYADSGARSSGKKWSSRGLEMTTAWQYVIDPNNPNYHYICYTDIGFARSTDAGQTWYDTARKGTASQAWTNTFYQIAFNPTSGTILAAVGGLHDIDHSWPLGRAGSGGVVKSTDYGATWAPSSTGLPVSPTTSIVFDPVNNIYFAASWGNGVYKSADATGSSWIATAPVAIGTNHDVYSLKLVNGKLYCLLSAQKTYANPGGLFVSANQGASWQNLATNVDAGSAPLKYPTDFDVNPLDNNIIFIAAQDGGGTSDGGLWRTANNGGSWTIMNMPVGHTPYGYSPMIDPGNTLNVYYSTENQGIFQTKDGGSTWTRLTGIPFASVQHMTFATNGTYVTTFGGGVWSQTAGTPTQTSTAAAAFTPSLTKTQMTANTQTFTPTITASGTVQFLATQTLTLSSTPTLTITYISTPAQTTNLLWSATYTPTQTTAFTVTLTQTIQPAFTASLTATVTPSRISSPQVFATITPVTVNRSFGITDTLLYPNPVTDPAAGFKVKIGINGTPVSVRMTIYSVSFRLIRDIKWFSGDIDADNDISAPSGTLSGFANGIYYYELTAVDISGKDSKSRITPFLILK
jgi:photosystem II stability/assembly factor-like uncharacterized protein